MFDSDFEIDAWFHGFLGSFGGQGLVSYIVGARRTTAIMGEICTNGTTGRREMKGQPNDHFR